MITLNQGENLDTCSEKGEIVRDTLERWGSFSQLSNEIGVGPSPKGCGPEHVGTNRA
jgi:hypothetical protein